MLGEEMNGEGPPGAWGKLRQVSLDLHRIGLLCEGQAAAHPANVSIDHDPFVLAVRVAEDHVRCLASNTGQLDEGVHVVRDLAAVLPADGGGHAEQALCLAA